MTTALNIITKAMQKLGVLTKSEAPDSDEASDGLDALNDLLASWSNESMIVYERTTESFSLVAGTASYSIGSGQTFNTTLPVNIIEAHVRQGTIDYPITRITDEVYQGISDKNTRTIPYWLNYSNGFPSATIRLYPTPAEAYSLYLTSDKPLTTLTLATTISLPPGWKRALIYNLAVDLAPEYGQQMPPELVKVARDSKANIALSVLKNRTMDAQPYGSVGGFSIYRGY